MIIGFDADDTLWHNEDGFQASHREFEALLADYGEPEAIEDHLFEIESRNMPKYGYGVKAYTLSLIECAIDISDGHVSTAEIAQIRASDADSVFFFLPGGMGISFLKQYAASGVDLPVVGPAFSFDQGILQAVGEAALDVVNTSQWNKDIDNPTNNAFVESFSAEYGRLPSLYASQGFDTANLLISAIERADVSDADAFRAALKAAETKSLIE